MTVRPATTQDVPAVAAVERESTDDFMAQMPEGFGAPMHAPAEEDEEASSAGWFQRWLDDKDRVMFVAETGGTVTGFLSGEIKRVTDDFFFAPYLYIDHVYVARAARRTGVGRALMRHVEDWAKANGMRALDLEVGELNGPGRAFYASLGFATITRRMAKVLPG